MRVIQVSLHKTINPHVSQVENNNPWAETYTSRSTTHLNSKHLQSTSMLNCPSSLPSFLTTRPPNSLFIICIP